MVIALLLGSRLRRVLYGLWAVAARWSHLVVYLVMFLNALLYANALSLLFPVSLFVYALLEAPRPSRRYWRFVLGYTMVVILAKFLFQLPIFCECYNSPWVYRFWDCPDIIAQSLETPCAVRPTSQPTFNDLVGLEKYNGRFFPFAVFWDVLLLLALALNEHWMKRLGLWEFLGTFREDDIDLPAVSTSTPMKDPNAASLDVDPNTPLSSPMKKEVSTPQRLILTRDGAVVDLKKRRHTRTLSPPLLNSGIDLLRDPSSSLILEVEPIDTNKSSGEELAEIRKSDKDDEDEVSDMASPEVELRRGALQPPRRPLFFQETEGIIPLFVSYLMSFPRFLPSLRSHFFDSIVPPQSFSRLYQGSHFLSESISLSYLNGLHCFLLYRFHILLLIHDNIFLIISLSF